MATTYLTRTSGTPTNAQKGTISFWIKRSALGSSNLRIFTNNISSTLFGYIDFTSSDKLRCAMDDAGTVGIQTNRLFRDTSAWYHIVWSMDTTQSTSTDRIKLYVNGVQETSLQTNTQPSLNATLSLFNTSSSNGQVVGSYYNGSSYSGYFDGSMSHVHFVDGTAYDASAFGSTDATTGEWKINTAPTLTMGTNGFTILKDGNTITDQSANSNDFTLGGGTLTNTEDSPSNVFATGTPLITTGSPTFSNGNNTFTKSGSSWVDSFSTIAPSSGKYYNEFKWVSDTAGTKYCRMGITEVDGIALATSSTSIQDISTSYFYENETGGITGSGHAGSYGTSFTVGDIIGVGLDLDNNKLYISKNGTWQNSANPSSGTGGFSINAGTYYMGAGLYSTGTSVVSANYGNGYFGTTAISSEGSNASGIGKFEYDVPTGYTALSTKGLNL